MKNKKIGQNNDINKIENLVMGSTIILSIYGRIITTQLQLKYRSRHIKSNSSHTIAQKLKMRYTYHVNKSDARALIRNERGKH